MTLLRFIISIPAKPALRCVVDVHAVYGRRLDPEKANRCSSLFAKWRYHYTAAEIASSCSLTSSIEKFDIALSRLLPTSDRVVFLPSRQLLSKRDQGRRACLRPTRASSCVKRVQRVSCCCVHQYVSILTRLSCPEATPAPV